MTFPQITEQLVRRVAELIDAGLGTNAGNRVSGQMSIGSAVCSALGIDGDCPPCVHPMVGSAVNLLAEANWSSNEARASGLKLLAVAQLGTTQHFDERKFARLLTEYAVSRSVPDLLFAARDIHPFPDQVKQLEAAAGRCEVLFVLNKADRISAAALACLNAFTVAREASIVAAHFEKSAEKAADYAADAAIAAQKAVLTLADDVSTAADSAAKAIVTVVLAADDTVRQFVLSQAAAFIVNALVELNAPGTKFLHLLDARFADLVPPVSTTTAPSAPPPGPTEWVCGWCHDPNCANLNHIF